MRALIVATVLALAVPLAGCPSLTQPVHGKPSTEAPAVQAARVAIDEANALLTGLNRVIGDNAAAGVWTKTQAQVWLDESKAAGAKVDRAAELLRAGLTIDAKTEAEAVRTLIQALQRRIAAEARKP